MVSDKSDLSNYDVSVDLKLSPLRMARVEAERAEADLEFRSAFTVLNRASPDFVQQVENLLAAYIHHVFFAFVEQALNQGFSAELIRSKTAAFLPLLVERTFATKHPSAASDDSDAHRARFQEWAIAAIHNSPSSLQVRAALKEIAERDATKRSGEQSLPNLPREALARIEQAEKRAREVYDRDKVPYFPMNPEFSFLETSIFRSVSHIIDYVRLFAEVVIDSHLKEYVEYSPSDLLTNETLLRSVERNIWTLTGELWNGYGRILESEPTLRRARYGMAMARGTIDEHPELEPWLYPDSRQWTEFLTRMNEPESGMARLNAQYEAAIKTTISAKIERYQNQARAILSAKELDIKRQINSQSVPSGGLSAVAPTESDTTGEAGGNESPTQQTELVQNVRLPLNSHDIGLGRELPPPSEGIAIAGSSLASARHFRKSGDVWDLAFEGKTVFVNNSKGMGYIAYLLRSPNLEVHSAQLFMAIAGQPGTVVGSSAGEVLDATALNEYKSRIEDLENQLDQAERYNDQGHKEAAQSELDQLHEQVIKASGLHGKSRKSHDDQDKIRKGVGNAIQRAIGAIRKHHPALAEYLKLRIKLGRYLVYQGDKIDWHF